MEGAAYDDAFVSGAARREDSAAERVARARRISAAHEAATAWRGPAHDVAPPARRRRRDVRGALAGLLGLTVVLAAWRLGVLPGPSADADRLSGWADAAPPPEPSTGQRLLPAVAPVPGEHRFALLAGGARWDPCRPVHYIVRAAGAPPGGADLLADAVARLRLATGLDLLDDGATQEAPRDDRPAYQPDAYGRRWAPVLVAWSTPEETPELAGDVAGVAGPVSHREGAGPAYDVSGQVVLDGPQLARAVASPLGPAGAEAVALHELGHLVGLDHVRDPTQLMNPSTTRGGPVVYAAGDLAGLAQLGGGPCGQG